MSVRTSVIDKLDWILPVLHQCLPLNIINAIASIQLGEVDSTADVAIWKFNSNGLFSVATASNYSGQDPRAPYAGYYPPDGSTLTSQHLYNASSLRGSSSEYLPSDKLSSLPGGYGLDDRASLSSLGTPGLGSRGSGGRGLAPLEDPALLRRDVPSVINPSIADIERSTPLRKPAGLPLDESNMLFVDNLPKDCTRREAAHLFRPFIGFKEIKVVHKEPRHSGDKAQVLCFVEFNDSKCALTAMEALQGYRFDDKKPEAPSLRIQFAKFPFTPPVHDDRRPESGR